MTRRPAIAGPRPGRVGEIPGLARDKIHEPDVGRVVAAG